MKKANDLTHVQYNNATKINGSVYDITDFPYNELLLNMNSPLYINLDDNSGPIIIDVPGMEVVDYRAIRFGDIIKILIQFKGFIVPSQYPSPMGPRFTVHCSRDLYIPSGMWVPAAPDIPNTIAWGTVTAENGCYVFHTVGSSGKTFDIEVYKRPGIATYETWTYTMEFSVKAM